MADTVLVGAVAYAARVVPIWEGIRDYFRGAPVEMDFLLFSNYERQVDALLGGHIDIAWNTNLAWIRCVQRSGGRCRALAMRDTDLAYSTVLVARKGSRLRSAADLTGRCLALGSRDSAHAAILPLHYLEKEGVTGFDVVRFDTDVGKHGDTGKSELDALQAVLDDEADAAAIGISTWDVLSSDPELGVEVFWRSPAYCHCNFTALDLDEERAESWVGHLLAMSWENAHHREILEMEGLRRWVRPELGGYSSLIEAVAGQGAMLEW
jgi:ABC-type phosphate/phosphonate transport system substrate-binding protein